MEFPIKTICRMLPVLAVVLFAGCMDANKLFICELPDPIEIEVFQPKSEFRDCEECPVMVVLPAGEFMMGSPSSEEGRDDDEGPQHRVTLNKFAVGKYEVTASEFARFVTATGHSMGDPLEHSRGDSYSEGGYINVGSMVLHVQFFPPQYRCPFSYYASTETDPVVCVSWKDAQKYVRWLSNKTGKHYRLLSESEWEYAARAGTTTPFYTGQTISTDQANYHGSWSRKVAVGSYPANQFGLHDIYGNVREFTNDCWHNNYKRASSDGSAWTTGGDCSLRVLRGGDWRDHPRLVRSASRATINRSSREISSGFRVARTLP